MIRTEEMHRDALAVPAREGVSAFVVTYRRPVSLRATLAALASQTRRPNSIIVMNNDPKGDVREGLRAEFPGTAVVDLAENVGSAGGFACALHIAWRQGVTWTWLLDDDATPYPDALEQLVRVATALRAAGRPVGLLAPTQISSTGRFGWANWRDRVTAVGPQRGDDQPFPIDLAYWAGLLVHRSVIEQVGYPRSEFFRTYADYEYCLRARRAGIEIVAVPASQIAHHEGLSRTVVRLGRRSVRHRYAPSRFYYDARNAAFTAWHTLRSPLAVLFQVIRQCRLAVGDLIYEDQKWRRMALRLQGTMDGLRGRMGRRETIE